jgi:hypothetical protein
MDRRGSLRSGTGYRSLERPAEWTKLLVLTCFEVKAKTSAEVVGRVDFSGV